MGEGDDEYDSLFDVLSDARRRHTVRVLKEHETVTLADVADEIATREFDRSIEEIDPEAVTEVYLSLYHVHVPKLVNADLVAFDEGRDLLALTDRGRTVKLHVDAVEDAVSSAGDSGRKKYISADLSLETVEAIHEIIERDERFDPFQSYDSIIRSVLTEAYDIDTVNED